MSEHVVFLTDFGSRDWYAGVLHGVVACHSPRSRTIDLTHDIPAGDIKAASFILESSYKQFPRQSIFCCVVDPGVGSERRAIAIYDGYHYFVGPDNGLFTPIINGLDSTNGIRIIENKSLFPENIDPTFHGRDIFAPTAAWISSGGGFGELGPLLPAADTVRLESYARAVLENGLFNLTVLYCDTFGNVFLNLKREDIKTDAYSNDFKESWELKSDNHIITGLKETFSDVEKGMPLFYFGSTGYLELAINQGRADSFFNLTTGAAVQLRIQSAHL